MPTPTESHIIAGLNEIDPSLALSYKQVLQDLAEDERFSYRGAACELREVLRGLLDHLAPDNKVLEMIKGTDQKRAPMKQKVTFILKTKRVHEKVRAEAENAVTAFEGSVGSLARSVYDEGSRSVHVSATRSEVLTSKSYADAILAHLLGIETQLGSKESPSEIPGGLRQQLEIWQKRVEWWANIASIIKSSSKLVVVESYFGDHHLFWDSLEKRLSDKDKFHFVLLTLRKGSPALKNVLELSGAPLGVVQNDKSRIQRLEKLLAESPHRENKTLEFLNWNGYGPGSVIWWVADGKEWVGLGCWLQCPGNTDGTPWIVLRHGPLFQNLKLHCQNTIDLARSSATSQSRLGTNR